MRTLVTLLGLSAFGSLAGCAPKATCNAISEEPPVVTVTNAATNATICDALIVASRPGQRNITLVTFIPPAEAGAPNCQYFAAATSDDGSVLDGAYYVPEGTYVLQVSKPGFTTTTIPNVVWQSYSCDEQSQPAQQVRVALDPS